VAKRDRGRRRGEGRGGGGSCLFFNWCARQKGTQSCIGSLNSATAAHCHALQHTAIHSKLSGLAKKPYLCRALLHKNTDHLGSLLIDASHMGVQFSATRYYRLQPTATPCNTLQCTTTHCNTDSFWVL